MAATLAEARAAYLDNADYETALDAAKARRFLTACRQLLILLPSASAQGQAGSAEFDILRIREEMDDARRWLLDQSATDAGAVGYDLTEFR